MNSDDFSGASTAKSCSRCGSNSANAFGIGGLCLRCAGMRVLQLESGTPWPIEPDASSRPLDQIGPYEIIEELGHGGMGRVYAARQIDLGRIVALKTIREGQNPEIDLRFLREIQTVARLRHPSIVAIHESGRAKGQIYFSMDYIEGGDLSARLKADPLTPKETALMMSKIADALAYAHGEGILHRDLKPSNILLDGEEPKLADFGLAAEIQAGGDLTSITHVLGTPHYLAPEAISGGSAKQTIASDIYSAGVILFEMLSGRTPFAGASAAELPSLARDSDPPSLRLLSPVVPKDLETICLKCLDREADRRYATATDLAADLRRFLAGEPVKARPASLTYRAWKLARRRWLVLTCLAVAILALIAGTVVSVLQARRAREAERRSAADLATSNAVIAFLSKDILGQASPDEQPNRNITLRETLDRAAKKVGISFANQPQAELSMRETLAETYERLGEYQAEKPQAERAIELRRASTNPNDGPDGEATLTDLNQYALLLAHLDQREAAEKAMRDVIERDSKKFGPNSKQALHAGNDLIFILHVSGRLTEAEALATDLSARSEKYLGPDADETISAESDLSSMYFWEGKLPEAEKLNLKVVAAFKRTAGPEKPDTLTTMANLAAVYWAEDKTQEAEAMDIDVMEIKTRVLGPTHPDTYRSLNSLGAAYRENNKMDLADQANTKAYEGRLKTLGEGSPDTLASQSNLALARLELGRVAEADELATSGLAIARKQLGNAHFNTLALVLALSEIKRREGDLAEAEKLRTENLAERVRKSGPDSLNALQGATSLGVVEVERGEFAEAEKLLRPVQLGWNKIAPGSWRPALNENLLAAALAGQGKFAEAEPLFQHSLESLESNRDKMPPLEQRVIGESKTRRDNAYRAAGKTPPDKS